MEIFPLHACVWQICGLTVNTRRLQTVLDLKDWGKANDVKSSEKIRMFSHLLNHTERCFTSVQINTDLINCLWCLQQTRLNLTNLMSNYSRFTSFTHSLAFQRRLKNQIHYCCFLISSESLLLCRILILRGYWYWWCQSCRWRSCDQCSRGFIWVSRRLFCCLINFRRSVSESAQSLLGFNGFWSGWIWSILLEILLIVWISDIELS